MTEIPKSWVCCVVADIATSIETIDRTDSNDLEISYIDIGSINNKSNLIVAPKSFQLSKAPSRARQKVKAGDVLLLQSGPIYGTLPRFQRALTDKSHLPVFPCYALPPV